MTGISFLKSTYSNLRKSLKHKFIKNQVLLQFSHGISHHVEIKLNDGFESPFRFNQEETCQGPFSAMPDWGAVAKKI